MGKFLEGMKEIEERSRQHTEDVLLQAVELFVNRKRRRDDSDGD